MVRTGGARAFLVFPEFSAVFRDFGSSLAYEFR
jgi:hypothetical protein